MLYFLIVAFNEGILVTPISNLPYSLISSAICSTRILTLSSEIGSILRIPFKLKLSTPFELL